MSRRSVLHPLALVVLLASTGCLEILGSVVGNAASGLGQGIGQGIGNEVGKEVTKETRKVYAPQMYAMYLTPLFTMGFGGAGGYAVSTVPFNAGDFVRFSIPTDPNDKGGWMERAFLGTDGQGRHWWRVKYFDAEDSSTITMEGLFTADMQQVVRLRAQFPDDKGPQELPVDQGTGYYPPRQLTKESIEGASKGIESVTVPAGSFQAKHVVFGGGGTQEWWLVDNVPGGVVKQRIGDGDGETRDMLLEKFGTGAMSELGSL